MMKHSIIESMRCDGLDHPGGQAEYLFTEDTLDELEPTRAALLDTGFTVETIEKNGARGLLVTWTDQVAS